MIQIASIRTQALSAGTIIDVSTCVDLVRRDHVWLLGDDASAVAAAATDLAALARIMDEGVRDDLGIRTEATRLVRILERRAARDVHAGLLSVDPDDFAALLEPDVHDARDPMEHVTVGRRTRTAGVAQDVRNA